MAIKTPWFEKVNTECPFPEYPRPQFERSTWQNLNGKYEYAIQGAEEQQMGTPAGTVLVPFAIECELSGVEKTLKASERLWYRRKFTIDDDIKSDRLILNFGAVDWQCKVFVNGINVGTHTGGYCGFSFDITKHVFTDKENDLTVEVYDPTDDGWQQRGKQTHKSHGFWYTATSGIWQTVWLEGVRSSHLRGVRLLPDIDEGCVSIIPDIENGDGTVLTAVISKDGKTVASSTVDGGGSCVSIPSPELWSPEQPNLYDIELTLTRDGEKLDLVKTYVGMRKFSIENDADGCPRLCLNNKPYFQKGLLDQGYWSDGGLTPPTDEAMIYDISKMKDLGFNMLRKHIKAEPLRWYYHCDRLGMLVWQDMISGGKYIGSLLAGVLPNLNITVKDNKYKAFSRENPKWRENYKAELNSLVDMLYNSVSICCWVPFNEGWGQFDAKEIGDSLKQKDPSRFVDHASGWYDQNGVDFKSMHRYILPVTAPRADGRPFVLSEYGGYSMIVDGHVWNKEKSFGYIMFKSKDKLTAAYKKLLEKQIIPLIPKGLCATVYTQVSDVEFEVNGMLTYDRQLVKLDEDTVKALNERLTY